MTRARPNPARPPANCKDCVIRQLSLFKPLSPLELDHVEATRSQILCVPSRQQVYVEGEPCDDVFTIYSGWAFRYKMLTHGRRQILEFLLPGDFIGYATGRRENLDHSVEALTDVWLCVFPCQETAEIMRQHQELLWRLSWMWEQQEAILFERITDLGRRNAIERVAHLLLEMYTRLRWRNAITDIRCEFPLTQRHIADALGLTVEHVNRVLKELRARGLAGVGQGALTINDYDHMAKLCGYTETYLEPRPLL